MIVTIGSIFVAALAERRLLLLFGYDLPQGSGRSGLTIFIVVVAVGVAAGIFQLGRKLLERAGLPILRPVRKRCEEHVTRSTNRFDRSAFLLRRCCERIIGADPKHQ